MINRKLILISVVTLIVVAISGGVIAASNGNVNQEVFNEVFNPQVDDEDVVAEIQDMQVTRGEIRIASIGARRFYPELSEEDAIKKAIETVLQRKALLAEVRRLGIDAADEGYELFKDAKATCEDLEQGGDCRDFIKARGFSLDEFWEQALPGYIEEAALVKLKAMYIEEKGLTQAPYEEVVKARGRYGAEVLARAKIVWNDPSMETIYAKRSR